MVRTVIENTAAAAASGADSPARLWAREVSASLRLATPLVFTQLSIIAIVTTDVIMMGWLGPTALAAGALGSYLYSPFLLFGIGIANAVAPMTAQALGARDLRGVRRSVRQGFWVAFTAGTLFCIVLWNAQPILLLFGQEEGNAVLAEGYLRAALWGLIPSLWIVVLRCFVSTLGRPRSVMVITLVGVAVNALADYVLMFGHFGFPRLELVGAGLASSFVNSFMFLCLLGFVLRDRQFRRYGLLVRLWRADWQRYWDLVRLGIPIGLTSLAESALFAAAGFLMGLLGTAQLAAHAIALQCAAVAFMVPLGVGYAVTVRVGLAAGAGDDEGVRRAGWVALALGVCFTSVTAILFWLEGRLLVGLFLDLQDPANQQVISFAVSFLAIAALFQLVDGAQAIGMGALRGLKDTRVPMFLALFSYWVVGFSSAALLAFTFGFEGEGVWIGLAVSLTVAAVLVVGRFHWRRRFLLAPRPAGS